MYCIHYEHAQYSDDVDYNLGGVFVALTPKPLNLDMASALRQSLRLPPTLLRHIEGLQVRHTVE